MNPTLVVITYNRLKSLKRLLKSLNYAKYNDLKVDLIISIDYGDNIELINYCENFDWKHGDKRVVTHKFNLGLKKHVLECGDYTNEFGSIIMLEDDLIVSKNFYIYAKLALEYYSGDNNIAGISLYNYEVNEFSNNSKFTPINDGYDIYFAKVPSSWGQAWNRDQWNSFKLWFEKNGDMRKCDKDLIPIKVFNWKESSWKKYFHLYLAISKKYFVYPRISLSSNMCELGTHNKEILTTYQVNLDNFEHCDYKFIELDNSMCKYDSFLESETIGKYLDENLCDQISVNFFSEKINTGRYELSTKVLNYKIIKKWGLNLKPYEMNIIYDIEGSDIYLYDKKIKCENKFNKFKNKVNKIKYDNPCINRRKLILLGLENFKEIIYRTIKG